MAASRRKLAASGAARRIGYCHVGRTLRGGTERDGTGRHGQLAAERQPRAVGASGAARGGGVRTPERGAGGVRGNVVRGPERGS